MIINLLFCKKFKLDLDLVEVSHFCFILPEVPGQKEDSVLKMTYMQTPHRGDKQFVRSGPPLGDKQFVRSGPPQLGDKQFVSSASANKMLWISAYI